MQQPSGQPKRDYLGRMRRVGSALGKFGMTVGKDLSRGGPSVQSRMKEAGFGKVYRHYGRERWSRPGQEIARLLGLSKTSEWEKKTIQQEAHNLDQKAESSKMAKVVESEARGEIERLRKDPKIAKMWIDKLENDLFAGGRFLGEKHVSGQETDKVIMGIAGIPRQVKNLFSARFRGLEQYQEKVGNRGTTQEEWARKSKELVEKGVLKERDIEATDKSLGAATFAREEGGGASVPFHERHRPESLGSTLRNRFGWGSRSNNDQNSDNK